MKQEAKMRILSLDPGGTTGWAVFEVEEDTEPVLVDYGQIPGSLGGFLNWIHDTDGLSVHRVVCESFTLREGVYGADLSPVYIIGALEALIYNVADKDFITYQEPKIKPLCNNDRLKDMGFFKKGQQHANDAIRHGLIYLRNRKHLPTLKLGWS
jgi:hypothetical protein